MMSIYTNWLIINSRSYLLLTEYFQQSSSQWQLEMLTSYLHSQNHHTQKVGYENIMLFLSFYETHLMKTSKIIYFQNQLKYFLYYN